MANRSIRASETIKLRARFRNDLQEATPASNVFVHIFEPDADTANLSEAHTVSGVPTYLGEGIYEYQFTVPNCGPEGTWYDVWEGSLNCQNLSSTLAFSVLTDTNITALGNQLFTNDFVEVFLPSGIQATDGTSLGSEYSFDFLVETAPSHTNIRKVRLEIGNFISNVEDDTIQTAILEASIEADILNFNMTEINNRVFQHARREYSTCLASSMLIDNMLHGGLKAKTLGDLRVEYDNLGLKNILDKLQDCQQKWLPQIMSGGGAKSVTNASMVIKGELDPDRPAIGRLWESNRNGLITGANSPMANTFGKRSTQRRYLSTFWPRTKRWW